jgi:hypothetical protein
MRSALRRSNTALRKCRSVWALSLCHDRPPSDERKIVPFCRRRSSCRCRTQSVPRATGRWCRFATGCHRRSGSSRRTRRTPAARPMRGIRRNAARRQPLPGPCRRRPSAKCGYFRADTVPVSTAVGGADDRFLPAHCNQSTAWSLRCHVRKVVCRRRRRERPVLSVLQTKHSAIGPPEWQRSRGRIDLPPKSVARSRHNPFSPRVTLVGVSCYATQKPR